MCILIIVLRALPPGREDLDVRMLGSGRPFVLEIVNAKAEVPPAEAFRDMQEAINALGTGVEVRKLQPVTRATVQLIKVPPRGPPGATMPARLALFVASGHVHVVSSCTGVMQKAAGCFPRVIQRLPMGWLSVENGACVQDGEQEKQKSYEARCRLPCAVTAKHLEQLNATKDLMLHQRTPTRVEHRRAMLVRAALHFLHRLVPKFRCRRGQHECAEGSESGLCAWCKVRERKVHSIEAMPVEGDPNGLVLRLRTQVCLCC